MTTAGADPDRCENRLVRITVDLSNHIRGFMKTFGLLIPAGKEALEDMCVDFRSAEVVRNPAADARRLVRNPSAGRPAAARLPQKPDRTMGRI